MTGFGIDHISKFVLVLLSYQISLSSDPGIFSSLANSPHHLDCLPLAGISHQPFTDAVHLKSTILKSDWNAIVSSIHLKQPSCC